MAPPRQTAISLPIPCAPCPDASVRGDVGAAREVLATMRTTDGSGAGPRLAAAQIAWREDRVRDGNRYARSGRFEFARYKTPEDLGRDDES
jgi:hypothetical protein